MPVPPGAPLPYTTLDDLWRTALAELKHQMTKATYNAWLAGSTVLTAMSTPACLFIGVRNRYAQAWLTHRLRATITRTLVGVAGHEVEIYFVAQSQSLPQTPIVSTDPVKLAAHLTPELSNGRLIEGEIIMTTPSTPTRVRIHSHITQSRFLHVEDSLAIGKLRLFAGVYRRNQGMTTHCHHFLDLADARVVFGALARGEQGFRHQEYKGTPPQARPERRPQDVSRKNGNGAISRVLSLTVKGENVYIELKSGPGRLTDTGAIMPNGKPKDEVNVGFKLYQARRMAAAVLAYIHAWDVVRMMTHRQMAGRPAPYLLTPVTGTTSGAQRTPPNGASNPTGSARVSALATVGNGRPVTRKGASPKTASTNTPAAMKQANDPPKKPGTAPPKLQSGSRQAEAVVADTPHLQYGDGSQVDGQNATEVQTFQRYVADEKRVPESKAVLLDYYQQRVQTAVSGR